MITLPSRFFSCVQGGKSRADVDLPWLLTHSYG
ncbi:hypothetical protein SAMN05421779_103619 [Insolitispirillum peregrinum]|uniref:Uncharacterized protein n=1 Tax=Insolitispirillum peregrinum TaxID=80876 RepID=A0A1N7LXN7_9PROT|nr:hypothetical protein SAMN05421779_103619 [Insolitispirillum peregrinum]